LEQYIELNRNKIMIKILQGRVVTQIMLDGLTVCTPVANFLLMFGIIMIVVYHIIISYRSL